MFMLSRVPRIIETLMVDFQFLFDDLQWLHLQPLLLSLLLTPYKATLSGMERVLAFGSHRTKHNEFLQHTTPILSKLLNFWTMMLLSILKKSGEIVYLIIDDTSNKKRGKHIDAAFSFFDHVSKQYMVGHQIVCAIIKYRGLVFPLALEIYVTRDQCAVLHREFKKKTDIAKDMIHRFEMDEKVRVYVLADSFYSNQKIMQECREKRYTFISVLKENRVFTCQGKTTTVQQFIGEHRKHILQQKNIRIGTGRYKAITRSVTLKSGGAVKVVFSKHHSHNTVMAVFTTNTALSEYSIIEAYRNRWTIEIFFKMSKTYLGFKAYHNRNIATIQSYLTLTMCAHNLLTHVFIHDLRAQGKKLTDKNLAHFSVLSMRDRVWHIAILDTVDHCLHQHRTCKADEVVENLRRLLIAA